ncbi:7 transmembrane sweet-taste receptor of 3 GCPR-domain-containing protein [Fimicolochytrium jonesii]|uniref:7 transmembrane sweet-taste receptor of 3 GCPR-domain-containing protein n=1 Tax=Fimicolochytrium jonesii TaxID=1396493 RepID=UPI0022FE8D62|nr:7 transmembrane sweet-taste receptor of 3 GCPR-domain-containing protein [Fimicolochytrium jonesii]KAI8818697.1 7 transmembrane sweet-taste receptor of 3 GCPR-domain-containing protein [Fimicolochytrium jonesii]
MTVNAYVKTNRKPIVGDGGGVLYCDGDDYAYAKYSPNQKAEAYNSWDPTTGNGLLSLDITPVFEQWKHMAIVSTNTTLRMYLNGELLGQIANVPFFGKRDGLYLCHWPFWGNYHYYKGFLDEFRVSNYARSRNEIQADMHTTLTGTKQGLKGYWNLDQYADAIAFQQPYSQNRYLKDSSPFKNDLVPGGCVPNKLPYCPLGAGQCTATEVPQADCWDKDGSTQKAAALPALYLPNAPVGGYLAPLLVEPGINTTVSLTAFDPDGDVLTIKIVTVPERGAFYTSSGKAVAAGDEFLAGTELTFYNPNEYEGGKPASQITYLVSDGLDTASKQATVPIHVKCPPGTFLNLETNHCEDCPHGQYMLGSGFQNQCVRYSNFVWKSGLGGVVAAIKTVALAYVCVLAIAVIIYRKSNIIRAASPGFSFQIIFGSILGLLDVYTYIDIPNATTCILQPLFVAVGFTIAIGSLVIKTLRVHILFNFPFTAKRFRWALRDRFLFAVSGAAVAVDWIILIAWFAQDKPRPQLLTDVGGSLYWGCTSNDSSTAQAFSTTLIVYNSLWLLLGIYSAVQVRNVKSAFNESQHIISCIYTLMLVSVILLPMNYAVELFGFQVRSLFVAFLLILGSVFVSTQLFIPKLIAIRALETRDNKEDADSGTQSRNRSPSHKPSANDLEDSNQTNSFGVESISHEQQMEKCMCLSYRQSTSNYYVYQRNSVKTVNDTTISLATQDGEHIKLRFGDKEHKDAWMTALKAGAKAIGPISTVAATASLQP